MALAGTLRARVRRRHRPRGQPPRIAEGRAALRGLRGALGEASREGLAQPHRVARATRTARARGTLPRSATGNRSPSRSPTRPAARPRRPAEPAPRASARQGRADRRSHRGGAARRAAGPGERLVPRAPAHGLSAAGRPLFQEPRAGAHVGPRELIMTRGSREEALDFGVGGPVVKGERARRDDVRVRARRASSCSGIVNSRTISRWRCARVGGHTCGQAGKASSGFEWAKPERRAHDSLFRASCSAERAVSRTATRVPRRARKDISATRSTGLAKDCRTACAGARATGKACSHSLLCSILCRARRRAELL